METKNMKIKKEMRVLSLLMVLALVGAMSVPIVSAEENTQIADNNDIVGLLKPIKAEIENKMATTVTSDGLAKTDFDSEKYSEEIIKKYKKNLDLIIDSLEKKTEQELSSSEREDLKEIIIQDYIERISWDEFKKKLGVKDEDFKSLTRIQEDSITRTSKSVLPLPLVLVQVADDVNGGAGIDGAGIPYIVNGDNCLLDVSADTQYVGKDLYECLFMDEDVPNPALDAAYDELRMRDFGTLMDRQGFFIYDEITDGYRDIEFGNDYDNGCSYGTRLGQHGAHIYNDSYTTGVRIYISNVWNHAMGLDDRNSNMVKITHYFT